MEVIVQWNCEGAKPKLHNLQEIIREEDPVCLCLGETKLREDNDSDFKINGYKPFLKTLHIREGENAHGGVGIWVKNSKPAHH